VEQASEVDSGGEEQNAVITLEDLKPFCSKDESRISINTPFIQDGFTYATDGRMLLRVRSALECAPPIGNPPKIGPYFQFPPEDAKPLAFDFSKLGDQPGLVDCEDCGGSGYWNCSHCGTRDVECENCDGAGKVTPKENSVEIAGRHYNPLFLRRIAKLPKVEWVDWLATVASNETAPGTFRFDGGEGLLMPLKKEDKISP
jgi:hypothetical protein